MPPFQLPGGGGTVELGSATIQVDGSVDPAELQRQIAQALAGSAPPGTSVTVATMAGARHGLA